MTDATKLARLWVGLDDVKGKIDNELLPLLARLEVPDVELEAALENLSARVADHFNRHKLEATRRRA